MLGKPVIRGTRIPVELVLRKLSEGATEAELNVSKFRTQSSVENGVDLDDENSASQCQRGYLPHRDFGGVMMPDHITYVSGSSTVIH